MSIVFEDYVPPVTERAVPELVDAAQAAYDRKQVVAFVGSQEEAEQFYKEICKAARYLGFTPQKKINQADGKNDWKIGVLVRDKISRARKEEVSDPESE